MRKKAKKHFLRAINSIAAKFWIFFGLVVPTGIAVAQNRTIENSDQQPEDVKQLTIKALKAFEVNKAAAQISLGQKLQSFSSGLSLAQQEELQRFLTFNSADIKEVASPSGAEAFLKPMQVRPGTEAFLKPMQVRPGTEAFLKPMQVRPSDMNESLIKYLSSDRGEISFNVKTPGTDQILLQKMREEEFGVDQQNIIEALKKSKELQDYVPLSDSQE